ncbi:MAG TPA: hypothetical protein VFF81_12080 [Noviherbaspirillum sp.]|nr:hypothetical protein [Noviherbaspirillum sp.]
MKHLSSFAAAGMLSLAALPVAAQSQTVTIYMTGVVTNIYGPVNYQLGDQFVIALTGDTVAEAVNQFDTQYEFTATSLTLPRDWGIISDAFFASSVRVNDNDNVINAFDRLSFGFSASPVAYSNITLTDDQGLALSNESLPLSLDLSAFEGNDFFVDHSTAGPWGENCSRMTACRAEGRITSYSLTPPSARPGNAPATVPGRPGFTPGRPTTTPPATPPGRPR